MVRKYLLTIIILFVSIISLIAQGKKKLEKRNECTNYKIIVDDNFDIVRYEKRNLCYHVSYATIQKDNGDMIYRFDVQIIYFDKLESTSFQGGFRILEKDEEIIQYVPFSEVTGIHSIVYIIKDRKYLIFLDRPNKHGYDIISYYIGMRHFTE